jgi:hypothetical protein
MNAAMGRRHEGQNEEQARMPKRGWHEGRTKEQARRLERGAGTNAKAGVARGPKREGCGREA